MKILTAYIEYDEDTNLYVGIIPGIPGLHSQAKTLDALNKNLKEVVDLCREENPEAFNETSRFIGLQQIEVA